MYRTHWSKFVKRKKRCCFHGNKQLKDAWRKKTEPDSSPCHVHIGFYYYYYNHLN